MKWFILSLMLFMHIVDDYYLQGCLAQLKQKIWWNKNEPDKMYRNDYKMALFCHGFSWSFMITFPLVLCVAKVDWVWLLISLPANCLIHCIVDDLKANKRKINLIADQCIHFAQIIITWFVYVMLLIK